MKQFKADWQYIPLSKGFKTMVDNADFAELSKYKWHVAEGGGKHYAVRSVKTKGKVQTVRMSRLITGAPKGLQVDHINGDSLDNRRSNLRIVTILQNTRNRKKTKNKTSGYLGVTWYKSLNKWVAYVKINGKNISLGYHCCLRDAVKARNEGVKKHYGEHGSVQKLPTKKEAQLIKNNLMQV